MVGNSPEERKMFRVTPLHYVIFDEAHMLKNMNTQRYENLIRINVSSRSIQPSNGFSVVSMFFCFRPNTAYC